MQRIEISGLMMFLNTCVSAGVRYGFGKKVPRFGAVPGREFYEIDCSGFVREALRRAARDEAFLDIPDGSVRQHEWVVGKGFKRVEAPATESSGRSLYIAFLRPADAGPKRIGHVLLITEGETIEAHSRYGLVRRKWADIAWKDIAYVYLLDE
jgi:cell wall-associated NlpC family hydrolase